MPSLKLNAGWLGRIVEMATQATQPLLALHRTIFSPAFTGELVLLN